MLRIIKILLGILVTIVHVASFLSGGVEGTKKQKAPFTQEYHTVA